MSTHYPSFALYRERWAHYTSGRVAETFSYGVCVASSVKLIAHKMKRLFFMVLRMSNYERGTRRAYGRNTAQMQKYEQTMSFAYHNFPFSFLRRLTARWASNDSQTCAFATIKELSLRMLCKYIWSIVQQNSPLHIFCVTSKFIIFTSIYIREIFNLLVRCAAAAATTKPDFFKFDFNLISVWFR